MRVQGSGLRVEGLGCRVQGLGLKPAAHQTSRSKQSLHTDRVSCLVLRHDGVVPPPTLNPEP